jgi:hypothetical protein
VPKDVHRQIHKGPRGGEYNDAFKRALEELKPVTVEKVLRIRDEIVELFGLSGYRP